MCWLPVRHNGKPGFFSGCSLKIGTYGTVKNLYYLFYTNNIWSYIYYEYDGPPYQLKVVIFYSFLPPFVLLYIEEPVNYVLLPVYIEERLTAVGGTWLLGSVP